MKDTEYREPIESLSLRQTLNILIFSFKLKAFDGTVYPKGYRFGYRTGYRLGFYLMKDLSFTPRQLTKKGKKIWYLYALIPKEVRQQNNNDPYIKRSCGVDVRTEEQALACIDGAVGQEIRDIYKGFVAEHDPLIVCAENLLEALYGTYNSNGRVLPRSKWLPHILTPDRIKNLKHYGKEGSPERSEYNLIMNLLRGEVAKIIEPEVPMNKGNKLTDYDAIAKAVEEEARKIAVSFDKSLMERMVYEVMSSDRVDSDNAFAITREITKDGADISPEKWDMLQCHEISSTMKQFDKIEVSPQDLFEIFKIYRGNVYDYNVHKRTRVSDNLAELEDAHLRKREGRGKSGIKLKDLVLEWESRNITSIGRNKTLQEYRAKQRAFLEWAKNIDIADLNADLVNGFIDHLFTEHDFAKKTLKKYYTAIRQLVSVAKDKGWIARSLNPLDGFEIGNRGAEPKSYDKFDDSGTQIRQLFSLDIPEQERMLLQLLACTGCRLNEMASIEWEDIKRDDDGVWYFDLTRPSLVVKEWKGSIAWSRRGVPIVSALQPLLDAWRVKTGGTGRLFNYRQTSDGTASTSASDSLNPYIHRVRKPDQDNLVVHSLRGYFITLLVLSDVDDTLRKIIVGQKPSGEDASYVNTRVSQSRRLNMMERADFSFINTPRLEVSE